MFFTLLVYLEEKYLNPPLYYSSLILAPPPITSKTISFRICQDKHSFSSSQTWFWTSQGDKNNCDELYEINYNDPNKHPRTHLVFVAPIPNFENFKMSPLFNSLTGILDFQEFAALPAYDYRTLLLHCVHF